jgi:SAM-dependent methyltransferase
MKCFVCQSENQRIINAKAAVMLHCNTCGAEWQQQQKEYVYTEDYYKKIWGYSEETDACVAKSKYAMSKKALAIIKQYNPQTILDVGCGLGYLMSFLKNYDVEGVEISNFAREIAEKRTGKKVYQTFKEIKKKYDLLVFFDSFEHIKDQEELFNDIQRLLNKNGKVIVIMPASDSCTAKILGKYWIEYKQDHILFYSKKAFKIQLEKYQFKPILIKPIWKTVTIYYLLSYLSFFHAGFLKNVRTILPSFILNIPISIPIGQMLVVFERK